MSGATVVSAFYPMPASRHSLTNYKKWMRLFFESVPCYLVFFCEEDLVEFVTDCRRAVLDKTHIVVLSRSEFRATTAFSSDFWLRQFYMDPDIDIHSEDMYKVWYEKKEFVLRAISLNPFEHKYFVWADAGILRDPLAVQWSVEFPLLDRIPEKKMLLLSVKPFTDLDREVVRLNGISLRGGNQDSTRVGAGVMAARFDVWSKWSAAYDVILDKYTRMGFFCGKEQTIMNSICLEYPGLILLKTTNPIEPWRYLLYYLGSKKFMY